MVYITRYIAFLELICTVFSNSIFHKKDDFENIFCEDKMIPRGIKRSFRECASLCSLNYMCTGFFFGNAKYCFSTEEQVLNVSTCSFREGNYYVKMGMFVFCLMSNSLTYLLISIMYLIFPFSTGPQ